MLGGREKIGKYAEKTSRCAACTAHLALRYTGDTNIEWERVAFGKGKYRRKTIGFGKYDKKTQGYSDLEMYVQSFLWS